MTFIHGELSWSPSPAVRRAGVEAMLGAVAHLPWDDGDVRFIDGDGSKVLLAYQSRSADRRPAAASLAEADLHVIADLRLDNRDELAARMGFADRPSDAELVLHAYRRWGTACVERLRGDGVFALWDGTARRLVCWRDIAGARPLYFHHSPGGCFVFSSDLRSMVAHPDVPTTLDLAYARSLIEVGMVFQHPERTMCAEIRKLPAGHVLVLDRNGCRSTRYWEPGAAPERRYADHTDYIDELRELLRASVQCRLPPAPAGVAAHLSGGLDSSGVAVTAQRLRAESGRSVTGISWAPPWATLDPLPEDERVLAESAARYGDVPLAFTEPTANDITDVEASDLAVRPMTTLQTEFAASRAAAFRGEHTIVSGWGGDELAVYNGKGYFAALALRGRWATLWRELGLRSEIHESSRYRALHGRVLLPLLPDALYHRVHPGLAPPALRFPDYLHRDIAAALAAVEPLPYPTIRERPGVRPLQIAKLTYGHLQYRMESWAAHGADLGITYAYPLLDQRIIEFALSIPDHLYFKNGWKRWLYRTAMAGILPDDVRWNPHKFDMAMSARLRQLRPDAHDLFRKRLEERRGNPYVDVDRFWDAVEGDDLSGVGTAAFLSFTDADPPR